MKDKRTTTVHVNVIVINITSIVAFFSAVRIIFFRSMVNISRSRRRRKMRINTMRKECWKIAGDCGPGPPRHSIIEVGAFGPSRGHGRGEFNPRQRVPLPPRHSQAIGSELPSGIYSGARVCWGSWRSSRMRAGGERRLGGNGKKRTL